MELIYMILLIMPYPVILVAFTALMSARYERRKLHYERAKLVSLLKLARSSKRRGNR